ncbi:hypothetical protein SPRG_14914 [Saprolegnia parasitica CBS 223.65]|uniref:RING-type domain-containing protein n=1 Tax=Saprolegnia parasitica (strain CBS 223.65) TaxID=695850 RepID=A0A067BK06_SAPPC|nr:hypothetical protein SPRG_14914 [Saprolegnia parasitica CBS 223.65]KDO18779.1 hypothetical protein SPRG_14914 [Saprolegnia parasitica CBS 223.65]|eukprot:XP_012210501.1 hypothetical protein SPRG_14914 [Saprolegnia parasitica CBS 223.65]
MDTLACFEDEIVQTLPVKSLEIDCASSASTDGTSGPSTPVSVPDTAVCDVCMDDVDCTNLVARLCRDDCPARLCPTCIAGFLDVRARDAIFGVLTKLPCPVCVTPMNTVRFQLQLDPLFVDASPSAPDETLIESEVEARESGSDAAASWIAAKQAAKASILESLAMYDRKLAGACTMKCPSCHSDHSQLPASSSDPLELPAALELHLPALLDVHRRFCQHEASVTELVAFVDATFSGEDTTDVKQKLLQSTADKERQGALFLRLVQQNPFIQTLCCSVDVCFACQTAGHHHGSECVAGALGRVHDIVACPSCALPLVKGDGCDSVNCFCGAAFNWPKAVLDAKMRQLTTRHKASISALVVAVRRYQMRARFRKHCGKAGWPGSTRR